MIPIPMHRRGDAQCPTDLVLLSHPLAFIANNNFCVRRVCTEIERIIGSEALDREAAQKVLHFLNEDLPTHLRDEAEDLFPHMRRRCPPEDKIEQSITRVMIDQGAASALLPRVRNILTQCLEAPGVPTAPEAEQLVQFMTHVQRHLIAETAILLPLARVRLTTRDLQSMSLRMKTRRQFTSGDIFC